MGCENGLLYLLLNTVKTIFNYSFVGQSDHNKRLPLCLSKSNSLPSFPAWIYNSSDKQGKVVFVVVNVEDERSIHDERFSISDTDLNNRKTG